MRERTVMYDISSTLSDFKANAHLVSVSMCTVITSQFNYVNITQAQNHALPNQQSHSCRTLFASSISTGNLLNDEICRLLTFTWLGNNNLILEYINEKTESTA